MFSSRGDLCRASAGEKHRSGAGFTRSARRAPIPGTASQRRIYTIPQSPWPSTPPSDGDRASLFIRLTGDGLFASTRAVLINRSISSPLIALRPLFRRDLTDKAVTDAHNWLMCELCLLTALKGNILYYVLFATVVSCD